MKKLFASLASIAIAGLVFVSCSKDKTVSSPVDNTPRLITKWTTSSGSVVLKYDANNRYSEMNNQGIAVQEFTYGNGTLTGKLRDNTGFVYFDADGKLDASGRLTELPMVYHQAGSPDMPIKYEYTYDANGYLLKKKRISPSNNLITIEDFTWVDGNLMKVITTDNGQFSYRTDYTYYDQLPNPLTLDIMMTAMSFMSDGLTGKRPKNLLKTRHTINSANNVAADHEYTYVLDGKGFPISYKFKNLFNNYEGITTFEYNKP